MESEGVCLFSLSSGNSVEGWGSDGLIISEINWIKVKEYRDKLQASKQSLPSDQHVSKKGIKRKSIFGFNTGIFHGAIEDERTL